MKDDKIGVALEYAGDIPRILAVAKGILFESLIKIAKEHNITIYQDSNLAQVLAQFPIGSEIPEELFKAVSDVLAYCYRMNDTFKSKIDNMGMI